MSPLKTGLPTPDEDVEGVFMINAQDKVVSLVTKAKAIIKTVGDRPPTIHQVEEKDDKELCIKIKRKPHQDRRSI